MGLDIYAGTLTRYYAHNWKSAVQQWAEENGYTGIDDKILEDTVNQEYINAYYNTNTNEKNIGGR